MSSEGYKILLTFDVEDWFQVENFKKCIPFSSWPSYELRVEKNTHRLLDLFDSFNGQRTTDNGQHEKVQCTFFVLGWIAERLPNLVREINARGHEVASHGYNHSLCYQQACKDLKKDLTDSKKLLEDIIGAPVFGYRAPSFSINEEILKQIQNCGYLYDSSYNSFGMHGRYGHLNLSQNGARGIAHQISKIQNPSPVRSKNNLSGESNNNTTSYERLAIRYFYELPISNLYIKNPISYKPTDINSGRNIRNCFVLPWGGGGYFRSLPFSIFKKGMETILKTQNAYLFYLHPWEIDVEQPKVKDTGLFYRIRHYINLDKTYIRLLELIQTFKHFQFISCIQYIKNTIH